MADVIRGDARTLPLPDASVDLIVTSPPYWSLRSYTDNGEHYDAQIGAEPTPAAYIDSLIECTREWMRVLKPTGSIFVNLGDKYSERGGPERAGGIDGKMVNHRAARPRQRGYPDTGIRAKSLMLLPERYRIACIDQLGLIARSVIIWGKPNGLPESVTDRVRRSHEDWVHLVKSPRYFSAVDAIREPHAPWTLKAYAYEQRNGGYNRRVNPNRVDEGDASDYAIANPLGKLPGSVWTIATQPLNVPDHISHARCCDGRKRPGCTDGVDHFAAFPMEWPRRIIRGWSPSGICTACGEGRRPVVDVTRIDHRPSRPNAYGAGRHGTNAHTLGTVPSAVITGEACACTPYTDHPGTGESSGQPRDTTHPGKAGVWDRPKVGPWREYHFDRWTPAPTRPAVVVDPFGGTGTVALVADVLGRHGISIDHSGDYCRLAAWRTTDPGQRAAALQIEKPPVVPDWQPDLMSLSDTE